MEIEYDSQKAKSNFRKHGVSFDEAVTALYDPLALVQEDIDSIGENRWVLIGLNSCADLLTVVYTLRENKGKKEVIRLISARKATRKEVKYYA
jgi:uncharacterized DUF497 family protein